MLFIILFLLPFSISFLALIGCWERRRNKKRQTNKAIMRNNEMLNAFVLVIDAYDQLLLLRT